MADKVTKKSVEKAEPVLLSGGNPQIAKADGDAPVQAYIAAMPGWKSDIGSPLDSIIVRTVPDVRKAVRWNSPFYGIEGQGWFLNFHCFTKYVKVAFFNGTSLDAPPPGESKDENVRYLNIYEDGQFDETQFAAWVRQASQLPGWARRDEASRRRRRQVHPLHIRRLRGDLDDSRGARDAPPRPTFSATSRTALWARRRTEVESPDKRIRLNRDSSAARMSRP